MDEEEFKRALRYILTGAFAVIMVILLFVAGKTAGCGAAFEKLAKPPVSGAP